MMRSPWEWLLLVTIVAGPLVLKVRRRGGDLIVLLAWFHLVYGSVYVLIAPAGDALWASIAALGLVALDLVLLLLRAAARNRIERQSRTRPVMAAMALVSLTIVPLAGVELACRGLTNWRVLRYHLPIETVWKAGADDWRMATITADECREPDPVLLWRPMAHKPYNAQRFKGPLMRTPKPAGVVRVMCYGDSLCDGPAKGDWPGRLHQLLAELPPQSGLGFEVVNAGVAGYSSHQGLLRLIQEVDLYRPDLLVIGFGWNDAAQAVGPPDRGFQPPSWPIVALRRTLVRYRAYLVLTYYLRKLHAEPTHQEGSDNPRVSIQEYVANLDRFQAEACARGIPIVFLTRPHLVPSSTLRQAQTWRRRVPDYNAALVSWALDRGLALIDAQEFFEPQPELFCDECHFCPAGYQRMAELVRERLFAGPEPLVQFHGDRPTIVRAGRQREVVFSGLRSGLLETSGMSKPHRVVRIVEDQNEALAKFTH
jgi:lysophospholipase L1-like esterase